MEGCVAGITSSSSLSEEELWSEVPEAWAFLEVFTAWICVGVAAEPAGLRSGLTEIRGDLIALKNKNKTHIYSVIKGLARGREGEIGEGGFYNKARSSRRLGTCSPLPPIPANTQHSNSQEPSRPSQ